MSRQHTYRVEMSPMTADTLFPGDEKGDTINVDPHVYEGMAVLLREKGHGATPLSTTWKHYNAFDAERVTIEGEEYVPVAEATITFAGDVVVTIAYYCYG